jgi:hypothetical protein
MIRLSDMPRCIINPSTLVRFALRGRSPSKVTLGLSVPFHSQFTPSNLTGLKAPTYFTYGCITFTVVADSIRDCHIALAQPFGVGTRLEFSSILVLGDAQLPGVLIFIRVESPQSFSGRIGRSDEMSTPISRGKKMQHEGDSEARNIPHAARV